MAGKSVVVTGANGFVASALVKVLLERGYNVRGTVRNPDDVAKVGHLLDLPKAKERLVLYKADLLAEGAYDAVADGVEGIFHTAAAVTIDGVVDPQAEVIDPAVVGTLNVLKAASKAKTVMRVVYTSSLAAICYNERPRDSETIVDESWWSDAEWCRERELWYHCGKTLAERAAWDLVKNAPYDLVAIHPVTVLGEILQPSINYSSDQLLRIVTGKAVEDTEINIAWVDVEDVAMAHVLAYEDHNAEGRYICSERVLNSQQLAVLVSKLYPSYPVKIPSFGDLDEATFMKPMFKLSNEKLKKLGLHFTPLEEAIRKCLENLKAKKFLS